ncbi:MAG: phosphoglycerate kinase, partial [bacterium]|nr:phosphoglycerate kinase [bacterium]
KLPLIERFLKNGSSVLVAGKLANTILIAKGLKMSKSCADLESFEYIKDLDLNSSGLHWPVDGVVAKDLNSKEHWTSLEDISPLNTLTADECVLDMGPATVGGFTAILRSAKTIFWNGPVGVCEDERFAKGTMELARSISRISAFKVLGGGDTIAALNKFGLLDQFNHVSTGGGSMLEFLSGKKLPGLEALKK